MQSSGSLSSAGPRSFAQWRTRGGRGPGGSTCGAPISGARSNDDFDKPPGRDLLAPPPDRREAEPANARKDGTDRQRRGRPNRERESLKGKGTLRKPCWLTRSGGMPSAA